MIRSLVAAVSVMACLCALAGIAADPAQESAEKVRVLVVTGGHGFEKEPFFKLFKDNPEITYQAAEHPNAHALLKAEAAKQYDVLVLYDMHSGDHRRSQGGFRGPAQGRQRAGGAAPRHRQLTRPGRNTGTIIGARYYLAATNINGVAKPRSAWKHDVRLQGPGRGHEAIR